ncbi:ACT domain-containing protein [Staphylococcus epidermidis]|nr:ACT domain-containing protein [Staphylococcus epidermidis]
MDELLLVDEGDIEQAVLMLLEIEKTLVEGAGAAGLAALLRHPQPFKGRRWGWCCRAAYRPHAAGRHHRARWVRSGRLARLRVSARDVPGVLAQITTTVAAAGTNIEEVHHQRAFTMLAAQNVKSNWCCKPATSRMWSRCCRRLRAAGMQADRIG